MSVSQLSTEILQNIYSYAGLAELLAFARTSKRHYHTYMGHHLPLLIAAIANSYGPLPELLRLTMSSEPVKGTRRLVSTETRTTNLLNRILDVSLDTLPSLSLEMMKKMVVFGRVASRHADIFPQRRWHHGYVERRSLRNHERERLRRAVYNFWLYGNIFHAETYAQLYPDLPRMQAPHDLRSQFLRSLPTTAMIQLSEFTEHVTAMLETELYPSDSATQRDHGDYLTSSALSKYAWGGGFSYNHLRNTVLKYDPADLVYLVDYTHTKSQRAEYLSGKGESFMGSWATLGAALSCAVEIEARLGSDGRRSAIKESTFASCSSDKQGIPFFRDASTENIKYGIADLNDGIDSIAWRCKHGMESDGCHSRDWMSVDTL